MKLLLATNNSYKVKEIKAALGPGFEISSLADLKITEEIPEDFETLEENALAKAKYIHERLKTNVIADDTGLEITSLGMRPGVYSARYAGPDCNFDDNMDKVIKELGDTAIRSARFRTVIALILEGNEYTFEGIVEGVILREKRGTGGFGYDPLFMPVGYNKTFAEMDLSLKNKISHRALATQKMAAFLKRPNRQ